MPKRGDIIRATDLENLVPTRLTELETSVGNHLLDKNNPHGVTKEQVGLGSVKNYGVATQAEAEAGTSSNKYMTPQRTKQAIDALSPVKSVAGKTGAVTVTKSDVGLGSVDNLKQVNAISSGSTADPNTTQQPYILTNHANSPGGGIYWHIYTMFYGSLTGNRSQIAVSYNGSNARMMIRHIYGSTWTPWTELSNVNHTHSWSEITNKPTTFTPTTHNHNDLYYTKSETDTKFNALNTTVTTHLEEKGKSNGYASLDENANVPREQLGEVYDERVKLTGVSYTTSDIEFNASITYGQVFRPKVSFLLKSVFISLETADDVEVAIYKVDDNDVAELVYNKKFEGLSAGNQRINLNANLKKGQRYFIVKRNTARLARTNRTGVANFADELIESLGRAQIDYNNNQLSNYSPAFWYWFYNWEVDISLQGQVDAVSELFMIDNNVKTATLGTNWSGSGAPYTQTISVSDILATDNPIIDVVMSGNFSTDESRIEAWGYVYRAVTSNGSITFYATEIPQVAIPIQIKVVR